MNETLDAIAATLDSLLERWCTDKAIRAAEAGAWNEPLWAALVDAGVPLVTLPESADGLGLGIPGAVFVARLAARHAAPAPVAETLLANWLWGQARGESVGHITTMHIVAGGDRLIPAPAADGSLHLGAGSLKRVPWARHATTLMLVSDNGEGRTLTRVPLAGRSMQQSANLADEPRDAFEFQSMTIPASDIARTSLKGEHVAALMALMRAAQLVGAMEKAVELTIQYANERVQFGKPIARYQAIQHQIALMAELVASSAVMLEQAAATATDAARIPLMWAAKGLASEAAGQIAAIAHQVHGAIGFTREYRLQLLTRRLWSWREECGNENDCYARLGALAASQGADHLWPWIVDVSPSGDAPA